MSLFSTQKESSVALVFDIGSGSVGAAIILTSSTHTPTVLYSFRSDILFQEEATGAQLLSHMLRALSEVTRALSHEGFHSAGFGARRPRIKEAVVSLSAPWTVGKTSFLRLRNKESLKITPEVFASLLAHSETETREDGTKIPKGSVLVEQKLIKTMLNGYETAFPFGKEATDAEFAVFESFSLPKVTEKIQDAISHFMHAKRISFHSFSLLAFATLRELFPREEDFIFADVSGEQTELSVVKKGVPVETATFPLGKNHFIRLLKKHTSVPASGAQSFFRLSVEKGGTGKMFERVKKALELAEEKWRNEFARTLGYFSEGLFIPKRVCIAADDEVVPLLSHAIESKDFVELALSPGTFHVTPVNAELLGKLIKWNPLQKQDPFIGLIASCTNTLLASR